MTYRDYLLSKAGEPSDVGSFARAVLRTWAEPVQPARIRRHLVDAGASTEILALLENTVENWRGARRRYRIHLTPAEAAAVFEQFGIKYRISRSSCGAEPISDPALLAQVQHEMIRRGHAKAAALRIGAAPWCIARSGHDVN